MKRTYKILTVLNEESIGLRVLQGMFHYFNRQKSVQVEVKLIASHTDVKAALKNWKPDAAAIHFLPADRTSFQQLRFDIPTVTMLLNEETGLSGLPHITIDSVSIGRMAGRYLLDKGFRHFAYVGHCDWPYSRERLDGFRSVVETAGFSVSPFLDDNLFAAFYYDASALKSASELGEWLKNQPKPLAVFAANDHHAFSILDQCAAMNIKVPEEVAVLGVDNKDLLCEMASPSLSSIDPGFEAAGAKSAEMLLQMLRGKKAVPQTLLLDPLHVVTRKSTDFLAFCNPALLNALEFIRDHAHENIQVKDVVRASGVSRVWLEKQFRDSLDRTPLEEIHRHKINVAKRLLEETNLPIERVAEECGFGSGIYFSQFFRAKTGTTPSACRRSSG